SSGPQLLSLATQPGALVQTDCAGSSSLCDVAGPAGRALTEIGPSSWAFAPPPSHLPQPSETGAVAAAAAPTALPRALPARRPPVPPGPATAGCGHRPPRPP